MRDHFNLENHFEAVAELAKGKRTIDTLNHAGEGVFFSARIADHFSIEANGITYTYIDAKDEWSMGPSSLKVGSKVSLLFELESTKTTQSVFERYNKDFEFRLHSPRPVSPYVINNWSGVC